MPDMFKGSATKYETRGEDDRSHETTEVRSQAARQCVRQLRLHQVLSPQWISLVDSLEQLSRLAQLEALMPQEDGVTEQKGRVADSEGTLWDQEAHEDAIRILVEEAKVNLCLRMMISFKEWIYATGSNREQKLREIGEEAYLERKCNIFEESLGLLLLRGFMHVETLQLTDIPLLIEHVTVVLKYAADHAGQFKESLKSQENVVIYYFSALMKHSEHLNNAEVLAKIKENNLLMLVLRHVLRRREEYALDFLGVAIEGYSKLAENEDFMPQWKDFFAGKEEMKEFLLLEDTLTVILKQYPEKKSELRPLSDFFKKIHREAK